MVFWDFIQSQLLAMSWLNELVKRLLACAGLDTASKFGSTVHFFLYDTIKITLLLCVLIYVISLIQSYFPPERCRNILKRCSGIHANTLAALLGTVTPFCSCSSIPIFIGFTRSGLPLGVTFSFLISSPMVDLGSIVLLSGIFGMKAAFAYVCLGLLLAVFGGTLIEKLRMERYMEDFAMPTASANSPAYVIMTAPERFAYAGEQTYGTFKKVFPYILAGVGIGSFIHNWLPSSHVETMLGPQNPYAVILAVLAGSPMYADIFGTIPVAEALLSRGAQPGTVLAFMMAVTTLSLPSALMLRRVVKTRLLLLFFSICLGGFILTGYLFNFFQKLLI